MEYGNASEENNGVLIVIEALKIDKIPRYRRVRVWFLLLFAIAAATYLTMPNNTNMIVYREQLQQFLLTREIFPVPPLEFFDTLIREAVLIALSMYFLLLYAVTWIDSQTLEKSGIAIDDTATQSSADDSRKKRHSASSVARRHYPKFLLLAIASLTPYLFSLPLMNIPYYIYVSMFSMTIMIIVYEEKKIPEAMEASYIMTKGMKFFIFISFMFLRSVLSIISNVLQMIFAGGVWSSSLINAYFFALRTLAFGRLIAMLYRAFTTGDLKNNAQHF